ncbi:LOW QUALITY PROTEIN: G-protein coupled bile acid receptor 1 [Rhinoraja longicauda]
MNVSSQGSADSLASHQLLVHWLTLPLSVVIVAGSLALAVGIAGSKRLHNSAGCFFLSLAVSDLATGLVLPSVPGLSSYTALPVRLCYLTYLLPNFVVLSLLANLLLVHADRYLYIVHPLGGRASLRGRWTAPAILAAWLLPLLFASLPLLGWNRWPAQPSAHCDFSLRLFTLVLLVAAVSERVQDRQREMRALERARMRGAPMHWCIQMQRGWHAARPHKQDLPPISRGPPTTREAGWGFSIHHINSNKVSREKVY